MLSGVTADRRKNNRMMILDDFRFFDREGEASKKLENYGRFWRRIMRLGLSMIISNIDNYGISDC